MITYVAQQCLQITRPVLRVSTKLTDMGCAPLSLRQDMRFSEELVRLGAVARCVDWLREGRTVRHTELVIKLLCNVTTLEQGSTGLLQLGEGDLEGYNMCARRCFRCVCMPMPESVMPSTCAVVSS